MRKLTVPTAIDEAGNTRAVHVDPTLYTSVHQWRPITGERFAALLHQYTTEDANIDDFGNGQMHAKSFHLGDSAIATIHYSRRDPAILSPVLMTMGYKGGKLVCFSSLTYGLDKVPEDGEPTTVMITAQGGRGGSGKIDTHPYTGA